MQRLELLPGDIDLLSKMVSDTEAEGKSREEAFKQFARENGIKSVNAVRYKWITAGQATAKRDPSPTDDGPLHQTELRDADVLDVLRDNAALKAEVKKLRGLLSNLRRRDTRLKRENKQLLDGLQLILKSNPSRANAVFVIAAGGRKLDRLAQLVGDAPREAY